MPFPKRGLVGDSDCMSWNCLVLTSSASHLVGGLLSLRCWQDLEYLPVGVQTWAARAALESVGEGLLCFLFILSISENMFQISLEFLVESLGNTNKHKEEDKSISPRYN